MILRIMLKITLLDQFTLRHKGAPIAVPSRPAQSLLAYLVLNAGKSLRREKVAGLFWPDTTEQKSRAHLRHALWRLRKTLNAAGVDGNALLPEDNLHVRCNPDVGIWLDVHELLQPAHAAMPIEGLMAQLALHGEFLPGFNGVWDEWTDDWREHIERAYVVKGLALVDRLIKAGRWQDATYWCGKLLSVQHSADSTDATWHKLLSALGGMMESWKAHTSAPAYHDVFALEPIAKPKTRWVLPPDHKGYSALLNPMGLLPVYAD